MDNMQEAILEHFDEEQGAHIMTVLARVMALEKLVEALWTHTLAQFPDPTAEAESLREELTSLVQFDEDDAVQVQSAIEFEHRLDAIVERTKSL